MPRVHIFGASGSGTTTLAVALAAALGCPHLDTDDFFWDKTDPPFRTIRDLKDRQRRLRRAVLTSDSWTLSGSLCDWGDFAIPLFVLAVFLWIPSELRIERLRSREFERYGPEIDDAAHPAHEQHRGFLEWAAAYDEAGPEMRSRAKHGAWMKGLPCPLLKLEEPWPVEESLAAVLRKLAEGDGGAAPDGHGDC